MGDTMTWAGLDVHARSTYAAVVDSRSGELSRVRFGGGAEAVVAWLADCRRRCARCMRRGRRAMGWLAWLVSVASGST